MRVQKLFFSSPTVRCTAPTICIIFVSLMTISPCWESRWLGSRFADMRVPPELLPRARRAFAEGLPGCGEAAKAERRAPKGARQASRQARQRGCPRETSARAIALPTRKRRREGKKKCRREEAG